LPAFSYRIGTEGIFEVIPRFGLLGLGYGSAEGLIMMEDAGASLRAWTSRDQSVIATFAGNLSHSLPTDDENVSARSRFWRVGAAGGYGWTIHNTVSIYLGVGYSHLEQEQLMAHPRLVGSDAGKELPAYERRPARIANTLQVGSVLSLGYHELPLLQVHVSRTFSLDARASWAISLDTGMMTYDQYMIGFTWDF
jgi:hypothetical protein